MDAQGQSPDAGIMFKMAQGLVQEIITTIYTAPFGCGLSCKENEELRAKIMHGAQPPEVTAEPAASENE